MTRPNAEPAGAAQHRWDVPSGVGSAGGREDDTSSRTPELLLGPDQEIVGLVLTGYLDTEIRRRSPEALAAERFRWTFAPGIDRGEPLRGTSTDLRRVIKTLPMPATCDLSVGWMDGNRRHHLAPGRSTLTSLLDKPVDRYTRSRLLAAAAGLGSALKALRAIPIDDFDAVPLPAGPQRLARWLRTADGPWAAGVMHDTLSARLGSSRIEEILSWIDEMPREQLLHGRSGLGATVLSESAAPSTLLIGDEVAVGPRDFDISCVLGEFLVADHLAQFAHPAEFDRRRALITDCRDATLIAYGPSRDLVSTGRMTALRVLLELHDSAAYLDRQLTELAGASAELVDDSR